MSKDIQCRAKYAAIKSWLAVAGLWGAGLLPCPDCGAPMLLHFWPLALTFTLLKLHRGKRPTDDVGAPSDPTDHKTESA